MDVNDELNEQRRQTSMNFGIAESEAWEKKRNGSISLDGLNFGLNRLNLARPGFHRVASIIL